MKLTKKIFLTMLLGACVGSESFATEGVGGAHAVVAARVVAAAANPLILGLKAHLRMGSQFVKIHGEHPSEIKTDVEICDADGTPFVRLMSHLTIQQLTVNPPLRFDEAAKAKAIGDLLESLAFRTNNRTRYQSMDLTNGSITVMTNMSVQVLDGKKLDAWISGMGMFIQKLTTHADKEGERVQNAFYQEARQREQEGLRRSRNWRPGPSDYIPTGREGESARREFLEQAWGSFKEKALPKDNIISYLVGDAPR